MKLLDQVRQGKGDKDRGDLENAMREPEKYGNLIVRVGGFGARFVELDRAIQLDIMKRRTY